MTKKGVKDLLKDLTLAIKTKCKVDCCVNDKISWINCTISDCPLWKYRLAEDYKKITQRTHKLTDILEIKPILGEGLTPEEVTK